MQNKNGVQNYWCVTKLGRFRCIVRLGSTYVDSYTIYSLVLVHILHKVGRRQRNKILMSSNKTVLIFLSQIPSLLY